MIHGWNWKEKLDAGHSGFKGLNMEVFKVNTCSSPSWVNGSTKGLQGLGCAESCAESCVQKPYQQWLKGERIIKLLQAEIWTTDLNHTQDEGIYKYM